MCLNVFHTAPFFNQGKGVLSASLFEQLVWYTALFFLKSWNIRMISNVRFFPYCAIVPPPTPQLSGCILVAPTDARPIFLHNVPLHNVFLCNGRCSITWGGGRSGSITENRSILFHPSTIWGEKYFKVLILKFKTSFSIFSRHVDSENLLNWNWQQLTLSIWKWRPRFK